MALLVTVGGRSRRTDHLTLGDVLAFEAALGKPWPELNPYASAQDAMALVAALFGADGAVAARAQPWPPTEWITKVDDDLPTAFRDCVPTLGGESFDAYLVVFADPEGFGWPPDVTRRQRVRDLDLLNAAFSGRRRRR